MYYSPSSYAWEIYNTYQRPDDIDHSAACIDDVRGIGLSDFLDDHGCIFYHYKVS